MQCSLYNHFFLIRYGVLIHFKPILWKNCVFLSGSFTIHTYLKFEASYRISRSSRPECSVKTVFLEISHTRKHLCQRLFFNKVASRALAQVFSCEFCQISKNTFFHRTPPVAASELVKKFCLKLFRILQIDYIIYKKHKKMHCKRFEHIPCFFSGNIF